jgi:hypothetical protein
MAKNKVRHLAIEDNYHNIMPYHTMIFSSPDTIINT